MAKINLLPWRQELREQRKQEFLAINMGVGLVALAVIVVLHMMVSAQLRDQEERRAYIKSEITILDDQIKQIDELQKRKEELLARMKVIQDLQGRRPVIVRVFDDLVRTVPDRVYLTSVKREGDKFRIEGVAESNNQVSSFLRNLDASSWFKNPVLANVTAKADTTAKVANKVGTASGTAVPKNTFALTVDLEAPEPASEDDKTGVKKTNKEAAK